MTNKSQVLVVCDDADLLSDTKTHILSGLDPNTWQVFEPPFPLPYQPPSVERYMMLAMRDMPWIIICMTGKDEEIEAAMTAFKQGCRVALIVQADRRFWEKLSDIHGQDGRYFGLVVGNRGNDLVSLFPGQERAKRTPVMQLFSFGAMGQKVANFLAGHIDVLKVGDG